MTEEERLRLEAEAEAEAEAEFQYQQQFSMADGSQLAQGASSSSPKAEASVTSWDPMNIVGAAAKGVLKGVPQIVTRPADLAMRGVLKARESLGFEPLDPNSVEQYMPTNLWNTSVDTIAGSQYPTNPYIEQGAEIASSAASMAAKAPSLIGPALQATKGAAMLPRAGMVGAAAIPEGAAYGALYGASDLDKPLNESVVEGGISNAIVGAAGPIVGAVADDVGRGLNNVRDRLTEKAIGVTVKDVAASMRSGGVGINDGGALETNLNTAIKWTRDKGYLPAFRGPAKTVTSVANRLDDYGQAIGTITDSIDQAQIAPRINLTNTQKLLKSASQKPLRVEDMQAQVKAFTDTMNRTWDGSARGLFEAKKDIGKLVWGKNGTQLPLDAEVGSALYADLTESLQNAVTEGVQKGRLSPDTLDRLLEANTAYSNLRQVQDVVDPAAIAAQQQRLPAYQRAMFTTTGWGSPAAAANQKYGPLGYLGVIGAGALGRSRAGYAIGEQLARGGAAGFSLLEQLASNPYSVQGIAIAAIPRDWEKVRGNVGALAAIAEKFAMPAEAFADLPEPTQRNLHAQLVVMDPASVETVPGNYTVANGEFLDPMERDAYVQQSLDLPAEERAKIVGAAFRNKFVPSQQPTPTATPTPALPITMEKLNKVLELPMPTPDVAADYSFDGEQRSVIDELNESIRIHSADYIQ